jgi:hypothetical protein
VETEFFKQANKTTKSLIEKAAIRFGYFLEKKTEIKFNGEAQGCDRDQE